MKGQPANLIVRLLVGLVFLPEGIKKFSVDHDGYCAPQDAAVHAARRPGLQLIGRRNPLRDRRRER